MTEERTSRRQDEADKVAIYCSKLQNWDKQASVRVKARIFLEADERNDKLYFTPELAPTSQHPIVVALGSETGRQLLLHHLYLYLNFSAHFEHEVVNSVAYRVAYGRIGIKLDPELMFDAYKICCDESYHALFSADLMRQIENATAIVSHCPRQPRALRRLRRLQSTTSPEQRHLIKLFFCIVSETLLSATLATIPRDDRVVPAVRHLFGNHAEDEARHRAYFSSLLEAVWPRLTRGQQEKIGPLLPQFIFTFLEPDYDAIGKELSFFLNSDQVQQVMQETYGVEQVAAYVQSMAKATLRLLERNGVLNEPATFDAFKATGLTQ